MKLPKILPYHLIETFFSYRNPNKCRSNMGISKFYLVPLFTKLLSLKQTMGLLIQTVPVCKQQSEHSK